jgi:hypothetical protein
MVLAPVPLGFSRAINLLRMGMETRTSGAKS